MGKEPVMGLYKSQWMQIKDAPTEIRIALYDAITKYYFEGEETEFSDWAAKAIYINIVRAMDRHFASSESGKKGANNRWSKAPNEDPNGVANGVPMDTPIPIYNNKINNKKIENDKIKNEKSEPNSISSSSINNTSEGGTSPVFREEKNNYNREEGLAEPAPTPDMTQAAAELADAFNEALGVQAYTAQLVEPYSTPLLKRCFNIDELKGVISYYAEEWNNDEMRKNIRPQTLFANRADRFDKYLAQSKIPKTPVKKTGIDSFLKSDAYRDHPEKLVIAGTFKM